MTIKTLTTLILLSLVVTEPAWAVRQPPPVRPDARRVFSLPRQAEEIAEDVFLLGRRVDPVTRQEVEGYAFIHRRDAFSHLFPSLFRQPANRCYAYLATGAKWKTNEPWIMNPANQASLNQAAVLNLEAQGIAKWEDAADGVIGNGTGMNIIGNGSSTAATLTADTASPDGSNEVYFADVEGQGAIAVTIVWGIFGGITSRRQLLEFDQVYDDVDFDWSLTGAANTMDFDNIATHEIGHAVGMGHPSSACAEETMYAYADFGETKKRNLNAGDIAGVDKLY